MKRMFKKIASCVVAFCLIMGSVFMLAGCGEITESRVMNVDVNPKLEFVLDRDNKVVSVNALNDDGTCILQGNVTFTGLTAEEAVKLFIDKANEYGFVIETDTNDFTISISGNDINNLVNDVKSAAEAHVSELGLELSVKNEQLTREALEEIVAHCYQEYSQSEIDNLTHEQLVNLIKKSREETKDLISQDLKDLYYAERAESVIEAKIAEIKTQVNAGTDVLKKAAVTALETVYVTLDTVYNNIQSMYTGAMESINTKMQEYVQLKKDYIEARKAGDVALAESYVQNLNFLETSLNTARTAVENQISAVKSQLNSARNTVLEKINELVAGLNTNAIDTAIKNAQTEVVSQLKTAYEEINTNVWVDEAV